MKLVNTLLIILSLCNHEEFCNAIDDEIHERFERGLFDISPEKIKDLMKNGDSELGVPIFDPYMIQHYDLNTVEDNLIVIGELQVVSIRGLSHMDDIETDHDFWRRKIKLNMNFPIILSTGNYSIDRIRTEIDTQSAYGNYTSLIRDITVEVDLSYAITKNTVSLEDLKIKNVGSIEIYAVGDHNNERTGLILRQNGDTEENALNFCKRFRITNFIAETFSKALKSILDGKSIPQVKKMLG